MRSTREWWGGAFARLRPGRRSNGVRVRRSTIIQIRSGDAARSHHDWRKAALAYRRALADEPHLQHLWVQLGHMEKEAGAIERAEIAYEEAARLRPDDAEPLLHLGHMAKAWRQPIDAARWFVAALRRDRGNLEATSELVRLLPDPDGIDPVLRAEMLEVLDIDPIEQMADDTGLLTADAIAFDVTDLLAFFGQRRLPTGIQRVQIEVSLACMEQLFETQPIFCAYASARRGWVKLSSGPFEDLCQLARRSDDVDDPAWKHELDRLYRRVAVARTIRFAVGVTLVNLGTSWADRNYLLDVRTARARDGLIYVPLVFDLIPLIEPRWFIGSLVRDYRAWFGSLLHSADGCLAISESTRKDLLRFSAEWRAPLPATSVPVIRLDGDFRQTAAPPESLRMYGLEGERYVLFVSTLEPRKNHRAAFAAWLTLAERIGEAATPRLVCVGGRGWLNDDLHQMLRRHPSLRRMVLVLHGIPDDQLATLYEHCLFSLYPSFYEGWGLPVSEALSYGKVPAIARTSSLPEAGGVNACYFDPDDPEDIVAVVASLLDDGARADAEAAIRRNYMPRSWGRIAQDILLYAETVLSRSAATLPQLTGNGVWSLALPKQGDDDADVAAAEMFDGEPLRHGRAWRSPGVQGCEIVGDDATLRFHWAGSTDAVLRIRFAAAEHGATVRISDGDESVLHHLEPGRVTEAIWPLPTESAILQIGIAPITGEVTVKTIAIAGVKMNSV